MISAQDEEKSGGGKKLIDNTDSAIKNARNVMMIAKGELYDSLHQLLTIFPTLIFKFKECNSKSKLYILIKLDDKILLVESKVRSRELRERFDPGLRGPD